MRELYSRGGISNQAYLSQSAFWIVRREAIDTVYELALQFYNMAKQEGQPVDVDIALGYAMQMLCADPEAHLLEAHPEIWASDDWQGIPDGKAWPWRHSIGDQTVTVRPAVVHLPLSKPHRPL